MLNKSIIQGRITKDVELKTTTSGISVATFTVAVERNFATDGQRQTDFLNCVAWRNNAEFISKYFVKGQMIVVEGSLQNRKYQDQQGNNRIATEIQVERAYFNGSKNSAEVTENEVNLDDFEEIENDQDLPF